MFLEPHCKFCVQTLNFVNSWSIMSSREKPGFKRKENKKVEFANLSEVLRRGDSCEKRNLVAKAQKYCTKSNAGVSTVRIRGVRKGVEL